MEHDAARLKGFDVGQAATLHALSYLNRQLGKGLMPPVPTKYDWRKGRPKLTAWWNKALERPSVKSHFNQEYQGKDTAAFAQEQIADVLRMQGRKHSSPTELQKVDFHLD